MKLLSAEQVKELDVDGQSKLIAELLGELSRQKDLNEGLAAQVKQQAESSSALDKQNQSLSRVVEAANKANTLWKTGTIIIGILAAFATASVFLSGMWTDWQRLKTAHAHENQTFSGLNHMSLSTDDLEALEMQLGLPDFSEFALRSEIPQDFLTYGSVVVLQNDDGYVRAQNHPERSEKDVTVAGSAASSQTHFRLGRAP